MNISYIDYSPATKSLDIFFSGCNRPYCKDCCNLELADFNCGIYWNSPNIFSKIENYFLKYNNIIDNIFLLGGSPNHQDKDEMLQFLIRLNFAMGKVYNKSIWLFAREDLNNIQPIFKKYCSYIKCGPYIPELKCNNNIYKVNGIELKLATSNQKVYEKDRDY